jgi:hypothetical protein
MTFTEDVLHVLFWDVQTQLLVTTILLLTKTTGLVRSQHHGTWTLMQTDITHLQRAAVLLQELDILQQPELLVIATTTVRLFILVQLNLAAPHSMTTVTDKSMKDVQQ